MRILRISRAKRSREKTISRSERGLGTARGTSGCRWGRAATIAAAALLLTVTPVRGQDSQEAAAEAEPAVETRDGASEHEVRKGDTLWDLAGHYLLDPFAWQAIYELNGEKIEDPHWIYPGQIFLLPPGMELQRDAPGADRAGAPDGAEADVAAETAPDGGRATAEERAAAFAGPSVFSRSRGSGVEVGELAVSGGGAATLVSPSDFYRVGFLSTAGQLGPTAKTARVIRENPLGLKIPPGIRVGDRIMLARNGLELSTGDLLQAVREERTLGVHGRVILSMALVEVTAVEGDSARGFVTRLFGNYQEGDPLIEAEPFPGETTASELVPAEGRMTAELIGFELEQTLLGTGDAVFLDVGRDDGVRVGDEFAFFSTSVDAPLSVSAEDRLSVVRVVRLRPRTATARVVETHDVGTSPGAPGRRIRRPAPTGG